MFLFINQNKMARGHLILLLERVTGVGPVSPPWKGGIIPLYDTRLKSVD